MAEPASVPAARCKTSLASAFGLMSESSPAFTLPVSPLLSTLLLDINSDLSKFLEDQTVHGFLPVPGRCHRRYYGTSTSSFPGPYTVPPGVTSITLEKASEVKKRSVSLFASQVSSMETMHSGMCEVSSWLDWWLSTCGGFRDHLPVEVCADFERLMISGSRALEFLASQGCTTLRRLVSLVDPRLLARVRLAPLVLPRPRSSQLLLPRASLVRGRRRAKARLPFPHPPEPPAAREVKVKEPGRSQPDGVLLPMRVGGCLSLHWRQWQAIGAETWVVTVLRDGYRVPFTDSPPPLARSPVSFSTYRAGSPRAQALRQEF